MSDRSLDMPSALRSPETDDVFRRLCDRFIGYLINPTAPGLLESCHVLLCALELGARGHQIDYLLARLERRPVPQSKGESDLVVVFLRQLVLCKYGIAQDERREFLARWLYSKRYRRETIVTI